MLYNAATCVAVMMVLSLNQSTNVSTKTISCSLKHRLPREPSENVLAALRHYGKAFLYDDSIPRYARQALDKILECRSGAYGSSWFRCGQCDSKRILYSPCSNRHCPNCGWLKRKKWLDTIQSWELDTKYYHIVFTAPHELTELFGDNAAESYKLFFQCAQKTLLETCKEAFGCRPGILMTLHTWGQRMLPHVHIHVMMTAGGIDQESQQWTEIPSDAPAIQPKRLAEVFRKKFIRGLKSLFRRGKLLLKSTAEQLEVPDAQSLADWLAPIAARSWVADAQITPDVLATKRQCAVYLSEYVQGTAISDQRIVSDDGQSVTISLWNYRKELYEKESMPGGEFVRRYLWHIVPRSVYRIRYAGLFQAQNRKASIEQTRAALNAFNHPRSDDDTDDVNIVRQKSLLQSSIEDASKLIEESQSPSANADVNDHAPQCQQCGAEGMSFQEYRSPWHTRGDMGSVYYLITYFAMVWTSLDDRVRERCTKARKNIRFKQLSFEDARLLRSEANAFSVFDVALLSDDARVITACSYLICNGQLDVQLPLPEV